MKDLNRKTASQLRMISNLNRRSDIYFVRIVGIVKIAKFYRNDGFIEGVTLSGTKDAAGKPLKTVDDKGQTVVAGAKDLGNGMSEVTYMEMVQKPVNVDIAKVLDSICPKLVPLAIVMLLYYLFARRRFTPMKGIILVLIIGILGAGPFGMWPSIWG